MGSRKFFEEKLFVTKSRLSFPVTNLISSRAIILYMETITAIIESLLGFLLQLFELLVQFIISALNLTLEFLRGIVSLVS